MLITPPHLLDGSRWAGKRIGLLGGSFNPPHKGHVHISLQAIKSLELDFVWWLVTPHNPLKQKKTLMPYEERLSLCRCITKHPQIIITDLERQIGDSRTYKAIKTIKDKFSRTDFVLLTGMDNALIFHKWWRWRDILNETATAHITRPPAEGLIKQCPLRLISTQNHHFIETPEKAILKPNHTYWLMQKKMLSISSTKIRNNM